VREEKTYSTTFGAMTLQGPHQVAKQSRTTTSFLRASLNAALLYRDKLVSFSFYLQSLREKKERKRTSQRCGHPFWLTWSESSLQRFSCLCA
jgi:hypothetical protein